jgi:hypothetical protein
MGVAGDADHQLDGAAGRLEQFNCVELLWMYLFC